MRFALPEIDPAMLVPPLPIASSPVALSSARSVLRSPLVDWSRNWPKAPQESPLALQPSLRVYDVSGGLGRGSKSNAQQPVSCLRLSQT